ncbi:MAG: hypothetical protein IT180_14470 [Acidobacteria bacterium]|nr:hypothetical protein [Acidobacteriota bacterium]
MAQRSAFALGTVSAPAWRALFALAVGLLLIAGGFASWIYVRFSDASTRVEHTYQVLDQVDDLVARVVAAEAGRTEDVARGFERGGKLMDDIRALARPICEPLEIPSWWSTATTCASADTPRSSPPP